MMLKICNSSIITTEAASITITTITDYHYRAFPFSDYNFFCPCKFQLSSTGEHRVHRWTDAHTHTHTHKHNCRLEGLHHWTGESHSKLVAKETPWGQNRKQMIQKLPFGTINIFNSFNSFFFFFIIITFPHQSVSHHITSHHFFFNTSSPVEEVEDDEEISTSTTIIIRLGGSVAGSSNH